MSWSGRGRIGPTGAATLIASLLACLGCGGGSADPHTAADAAQSGDAAPHLSDAGLDASADLGAGAPADAQPADAQPADAEQPRDTSGLPDGGADGSGTAVDLAVDAGHPPADAATDAALDGGPAPEPPWPPTLSVSEGALVDSWGRSVRLRGASATNTAKTVPGHVHWQGPEQWAELRREGVVLVRLLVFWDGVEPAPGQIDRAYLEYVRAKVDEIAAAGLLVLVDMHQDLFCQRYSNGAPLWACPDDVPYEPVSPWFLNYLSPAVTGAFDRFWGDAELQGHLIASWGALGEILADQPAVIAFEPMNEPWPGSLEPALFERGPLSSFYEGVLAVLDQAAPGRLYVLEPAVTRQVTGHTSLRASARSDLVYGPHFYHVQIEQGGGYEPRHQESVAEEVARMRADAVRLGWPMLLGEYGGDARVAGFGLYLSHLEQELERIGASTAIWEHAYDDGGFALYDSDGERKAGVEAFFRPYALAVPGRRLQERFDAEAGCHSVRWVARDSARGPLELRVPANLPTEQAQVVVEPEWAHLQSIRPDGPRLLVDLGQMPEGEPVIVRTCWAGADQAPAR